MVRPRQLLYDVNHFGFLHYSLMNNFNKLKDENSNYEKELLKFEKSFDEFTGINNLLPLSRARLGIYLYLKNIITAERNEVLLSPFTIFDVVNMVIAAGGKPIFLDIQEKNNLNISPQTIKENISSKTCCFLLTNYHLNYKYLDDLINICRDKSIKILEDCAISFGTYNRNKHVGSFSDAAIFSFSLFKFISVYYGGALHIKDINIRNKIIREINSYEILSLGEMLPNFFKGLKMSILTNRFIFPFIFILFRYGFNRKITFIRNSAKNDPNPISRKKLPENYKRKPNLFQIKEFQRQLKNINKFGKYRSNNFNSYNQYLNCYKKDEVCLSNSYLNYPIIFSNHDYKVKFIKYMMNLGFDMGEYYYRSCNLERCFDSYKRSCPNSEHYSKCVVTLPTHYQIDKKYLSSLAINAVRFIKKYPNSIIS